MPETAWQIATPDNKIIHGVLNRRADGANRRAVLHVHGLTGHPYEVAPTAMANFFPDQGYDVIRLYLYAARPEARDLVDCTIKIHARDINLVARHFGDAYDAIFATGHSYGGPSLMCSRHDAFTALSLWDPTYDMTLLREPETRLGDYYVMKFGKDVLLGPAMYHERELFTRDYCRSLGAQCATPLQIVTAGNGFWARQDESFHSFAAGPHERVYVDGTRHEFAEEGTTEKLLDHTLRWFNRFAAP